MRLNSCFSSPVTRITINFLAHRLQERLQISRINEEMLVEALWRRKCFLRGADDYTKYLKKVKKCFLGGADDTQNIKKNVEKVKVKKSSLQRKMLSSNQTCTIKKWRFSESKSVIKPDEKTSMMWHHKTFFYIMELLLK